MLRGNYAQQTPEHLAKAFDNFLCKLPPYWKTKKFTLPNLNRNFNEIVSEMNATKIPMQAKELVKPIIPVEIKKAAPSAEEIKQLLKKMLPSIADSFEQFVNTGNQGYLPFWAMYDALIQENIFSPAKKKITEQQNAAITKRKKELSNPKNPFEQKQFTPLLAIYENGNTPEAEQILIERSYKGSLVKYFFEKLKSQNKNLNHLKTL